MAIMPADSSNHHPASLVDGCPECVVNVETPSSTYSTPQGTLANYVCLDCGHAWSTSWKD